MHLAPTLAMVATLASGHWLSAQAVAPLTPIAAGTDTFTVWMVRGRDTLPVGRVIDAITFVHDTAGLLVHRVYRSEVAGSVMRVDTMVDRLDGFRPIRAAAVIADTGVSAISFANHRVVGTIYTPLGRRREIDLAFPDGAVQGASFDLILRSQLLTTGDTVRRVVFAPVVTAFTRSMVVVEGSEVVGDRRTWRLRGTASGAVATFWVDQSTRALVRQAIVMPGGATLLFDRRAPIRPLPVRRAS